MLHAQILEAGQPSLVALAPRGHAACQPVLLLLQVSGHPPQLAGIFFLDLLGPLIKLQIAFGALQYFALAKPKRMG